MECPYGYMSCLTSALSSGQPFMMCDVSSCNYSSFCVASHISCVDMHSGMSVHACMASMLRFMPEISLYLFL